MNGSIRHSEANQAAGYGTVAVGYRPTARRAFLPLVTVVILASLASGSAARGDEPRRLRKADGGVKMLREANRRKWSPAPLRRAESQQDQADGRMQVNIRFAAQPTDDQIAAYEQAGVRFRRSADGTVRHHRMWYPAKVTDAALEMLDDDPMVEFVEAGGALTPKPTLDQSVPEIQADIRHRMPAAADIRGNQGQGIVIADFEVAGALDVFHPDFFKPQEFVSYDWIDADGDGRFIGGLDYVDLNRNGLANSNERLQSQDVQGIDGLYDAERDWLYNDANNNGFRDFGPAAGFTESDPTYGELVFLSKDDNRNGKLDVGEKLVPLGQSKVLKVRDTNGTVYTRGQNLINAPADTNGHGTSVCSILVGQDACYGREHVGVAPDAELIVVHTTPGNALGDALWAKSQGADVMLWEFGGWTTTYLDGSSALEEFITDEMNAGSTMQVTPNGNLADSDRHARVLLPPNNTFVRHFEIPAGIQPGAVIASILWQGNENNLQFAIRKVGSATFTPLATDNIDPDDFVFESDHFALRGRSTSPRGTARFDFTLARSGGSLASGIWELQIANQSAASRTVHLMIDDPATTWSGGVRWLSDVTDATTITHPATADHALRVASYSVSSAPGQLSYFSGRGPRIDGGSLEAVAAPGHHDIFCAQSFAVSPIWADARVDFGGTSAAGPHVAAAAALLMNAVPDASNAEIYDAILSEARQDGFTGTVPNDLWGSGKLRVDDAYQALAATVCEQISPVQLLGPADGSADVDAEATDLAWVDDPNAQVYDLYLGTTNPPPYSIPNLNVTQFQASFAGARDPNTTYYWQVYAKNFCGHVVAGPVRSFTTGGVQEPEINVTADGVSIENGGTFTFDETDAGQQTQVTFTIENNGPETLELLGSPGSVNVVAGDDAFEVLGDAPASIAPFGAALFTVAFTPPAADLWEGTLEIASNDADEGLYTIQLTGTAPAYAEIEVTFSGVDTNGQPFDAPVPHESVFTYPDTELGQTTDLIFHIFSEGEADLLLTGPVQVSGADAADFEVTLEPTDVVVPPNAVEAFRVAFTPSAAQTRQATVTIPNNDPDEGSYTFTITGFGVDPDAPPPPPVDEEPDPIDDDPGADNQDPDPVDDEPAPVDDDVEPTQDPVDDAKQPVDQDDPNDGIDDNNGNDNDAGRGFAEGGAGGGAGPGMCGAGGAGMMPVLLLGMVGLRLSTGRSRRSYVID